MFILTYFCFQATEVQKTFILIMASFRSGSSLAGSLFDMNEDVFYMFEPIAYIDRAQYVKDKSLIDAIQANMSSYLWDFFSCRFSKIIALAKGIYTDVEFESYLQTWHTRVFGSIAKRHETTFKVDEDILRAEEICMKYPAVVIKVIRADLVESILPLMAKGVKVIHLVRDPRGQVNSGCNLKQVKGICQNTLANINFSNYRANLSASLLLKEYYRMVRYEDLTQNLAFFSMLFYRFVGLAMTRSVLNHVIQNPQVDTWYGSLKGRVNTRSSVSKWVTELNPEKLISVEQLCGDIMETLGYIMASTRAVFNGTLSENFTTFTSVSGEVKFLWPKWYNKHLHIYVM